MVDCPMVKLREGPLCHILDLIAIESKKGGEGILMFRPPAELVARAIIPFMD